MLLSVTPGSVGAFEKSSPKTGRVLRRLRDDVDRLMAAGIATMEDVIETLLGVEIMDETDAVADMRAPARQQRLRRARAMGISTSDEE